MMRPVVLFSIALSMSALLVGFSKPSLQRLLPTANLTKEKTKARLIAQGAEKAVDINPGFLAVFQPLPKDFHTAESKQPAIIDLGRMLYFDKRLSKNHDISCNSCHVLDKFGVDNEATSPGHKKQRGDRNSPTVYNAAGHFVQFWDGRSPHVEHQATQPILNPVEMAMKDGKQVMALLRTIPGYVEAFKKAFPDQRDPMTYDNLGKAIGAFERGLTTPSRWDDFLKGKKDALTNKEKQGFMKFVTSGCLACHTGALLGGHMYQKVGTAKPWPNQKDQGRAQVTKQDADKMMFKVPSLRNVGQTAPYFHDGSAKTLEEAILMMGRHQLGRELPKEDVELIAAWLHSLTGSLPKEYIKEPALPPSTPATPKPDPN